MEQFSYSFSVSMLHSVWQMAVLLLLYYMLTGLLKRSHPAFKRNVLFGLLAIQLCTSLFTFFFYYTNSLGSYEHILPLSLSALLDQSWIQSYADYFFYAYCMVVMFKIATLIFNCISFKKDYTKHLVKPSADIKMFTILKSHQFGIKRKISIWYSNKVFTPLTFGFFKPVILMPVALMNGLSMKETESLIIHELTHIKNNDYLLNWLLLVTETIYFFNPFVKIIASQIKLEREKSCDTQVIQFNYSSLTYAETLLKIARQTQRYKRFQLAAVISKSQLLQRIHFFSSEKNQQFRKQNNSVFSIVLMLGVLILNIFAITQFKNHSKDHLSFKPSNIASAFAKNESKENLKTAAALPSSPEKASVKNIKKKRSEQLASTNNNVSPKITAEEKDNTGNYYVMPASLKTEQPVISKEVLINEENSSGKTVTKAYKVQLKNGQWVAEPLWMTTELKSAKDSLKQIKDSLYHIIDAVQ